MAEVALELVAAGAPVGFVLEQDFRSQPERITQLPLVVAAQQPFQVAEEQAAAILFFPLLPQPAVAVEGLEHLHN